MTTQSERRCACVAIAYETIERRFNNPAATRIEFGVPVDAKLVNCYDDFQSMSLFLVFQFDGFEVTPVGHRFPLLNRQ